MSYRRFSIEVLRVMRRGVVAQIVGDSQVLVDCLLGHSSTNDPFLLKPLRLAHEGLRSLVHDLGVKPPCWRAQAQQVPRADNSTADRLANRALDTCDFRDLEEEGAGAFLQALMAETQKELGLLVSFDGASRGNPGAVVGGMASRSI